MKYTGRPRTLTDAEVCEKYAELKDSVIVGILAGCSATTVTTIVRRSGGAVLPRGGRVQRPLLLSVEEVCRRYLAGESGESIARDSGTYAAKIYQTLTAAGVARRERGWHKTQAARRNIR